MPTFEQQLEQVTELISLPEIYIKISSLMDDPTSDIRDFANVIRFDPNLSTTVLKTVNSAFFGFSGKVESIDRAVGMIGIGQLNIIALSVSAVSALDAMDYPNDIVPLKTYWRCSLFAGVLCRQLALLLNIPNSERLFVVGLLHEIGHLVLYTKFPDLARQTRQLAQDNNWPIHQAEEQILGCHYGAIGANLMAKWNLSNSFQNLTRFQPKPMTTHEEQTETALLHIAHGYAHKQFANSELELDKIIESAAWKITGISEAVVEQSLEAVQDIAADMESLILRQA
jgi:HD-like signal output (HDOD) protein